MTPSSEEIAAALELAESAFAALHAIGQELTPPGETHELVGKNGMSAKDASAIITAHLSRLREEAEFMGAARVRAYELLAYTELNMYDSERKMVAAFRALERK